jgi:hypothetical protein
MLDAGAPWDECPVPVNFGMTFEGLQLGRQATYANGNCRQLLETGRSTEGKLTVDRLEFYSAGIDLSSHTSSPVRWRPIDSV